MFSVKGGVPIIYAYTILRVCVGVYEVSVCMYKIYSDTYRGLGRHLHQQLRPHSGALAGVAPVLRAYDARAGS